MPSRGELAPWEHSLYLLGASLACLVWNAWAGRDLNWDQLNYHLYTPYLLLDDRLAKDFMAAGVPGYLNPVAYIPFYAMIKAQWHSLLVGSLLALLHSMCLWLVYGIAVELIPAGVPGRRLLLGASVVLAFLAPVYLIEVGSSFIDVTTSVPALAGVLLLVRLPRSERPRATIAIAGVLLGISVGLKLTNVVFAVAAVAFVLLARRDVRWRLLALLPFGFGGAAGLLAADGLWALRLYKAFGNPLFPWYNRVFGSPDFDAINIEPSRYRFAPESLVDVLTLPVRIVDLTQRAYTETMSPDVRYLAFYVLGVVALVLAGSRRANAARATVPDRRLSAAFVPSAAFTLASYALWLATSGNGRYAIVLSMFMGPMLVATAIAVLPGKRLLAYGLGAVLLLQLGATAIGADKRWLAAPWKPQWFDVHIPPRLATEPALFLSLQPESFAFLAPFMSPDAGFVNLAGAHSLSLDRPGGARLARLLERHRSHVRTLFALESVENVLPLQPAPLAMQDSLLARVGLEVDPPTCEVIEVHDAIMVQLRLGTTSGPPGGEPAAPNASILSCGTRAASSTSVSDAVRREQSLVDAAFNAIETRCPRQFSPQHPVTDRVGVVFRRVYLNSDATVIESHGMIRYVGWRAGLPVDVGRLEDIAAGRLRLDCAAVQQATRHVHF